MFLLDSVVSELPNSAKSLKNSLFAGKMGRDRFDQHCVASHQFDQSPCLRLKRPCHLGSVAFNQNWYARISIPTVTAAINTKDTVGANLNSQKVDRKPWLFRHAPPRALEWSCGDLCRKHARLSISGSGKDRPPKLMSGPSEISATLLLEQDQRRLLSSGVKHSSARGSTQDRPA